MSEASPPVDPHEPHEPAPPPATTIWRALGEVAAIFATSPTYKFYTLADLEWLVVPALRLSQCRLAHRGPLPVGVVLWAHVDQETSDRMLDPLFRLRPDQWASGSNIWITDLIHTGGPNRELSEVMLQDVKTLLGGKGPIHVRPTEMHARLRASGMPRSPTPTEAPPA